MATQCPTYQHRYTIRGNSWRFQRADNTTDDIEGLIQQFQLQFQRNVMVVYDLASDDIYHVEGKPVGQLSIQRILAPVQQQALFDCPCTPLSWNLSAGNDGCLPGQAGSIDYTIKNAFQNMFALQGQVQNNLVSFSVSYAFTHVEAN